MINSIQLRLGNRVKYADHKVWRKSVIGTEAVVDLDIFIEACKHPDRFDPILLTPDVLETCRFEKECLKIGDQELQIKINENKYVLFGSESCTSGQCFIGNIKHLHQLQNLYFDLTGEELTIKPPVNAQQA